MPATNPTAVNGRPRVAASTVQPDSGGLMSALLAVAAEAPKLRRDAVGQIQNRTYGYTTLDGMLDAVVPILIAHDLVWVCKPTCTETGQPALRYSLTHVPSGESQEDVMPLMCARPDPQGQGSALTYARRYALQAVLNLAPDEDDDGASASAQSAQSQPAQSAQPTAPPKASDPQRGMLSARARTAGLSAGDLANVVLVAAGDEPRTFKSEEHADQMLVRLLKGLPAELVTAVKNGIDTAAENVGAKA